MQHIPPPKQLKKGTETSMKSNKRDVSTFIKEHETLIFKSKGRAGDITANELEQLFYISNGKIYETMWNSYRFGFIAGLHYAKNQRRK